MKHLFQFRQYDVYWGHGKIRCGILLRHKHYISRIIIFDYNKGLDESDWWHNY